MNDFLLVYDGFDPAEEGLREALTSTGNGYFCTRGCAEWEDADGTHYPGTYAHGIYNRRTTVMGIHPVPNEDLVNLPNWLVLKLRIEGDEPCPARRRRAPLLPARATTSATRWSCASCASGIGQAGRPACAAAAS